MLEESVKPTLKPPLRDSRTSFVWFPEPQLKAQNQPAQERNPGCRTRSQRKVDNRDDFFPASGDLSPQRNSPV
ncbi:MAG: hypothetical protein EBS01_08600 [Verrucomicrobia bacterium]|nr:hypothetical protein [Verrucomicrobiota bacterium]